MKVSSSLYRAFDTQQEIDAQYNPSARVSDAPAEIRHYLEQSANARKIARCELGIPYGPTLEERLDIFPADTPIAPIFIFFHGGYWSSFASSDFHCVALGMQQLGITTVVVNYALAPRVSIDEISRQARAAASWVLRNLERLGGAATQVAIGGHSAGAHLAAMCLQTDWSGAYGLPQDPFRAALLLSGIYDLEPLRHSYLQPRLQLDEGAVRRNSPLRSVQSVHAPLSRTSVLFAWGELESAEFERQSRDMCTAWIEAGQQGVTCPVPGANHFSALHELEHGDRFTLRWLAKTLGSV